jgi:hypothetical protein
MRKTIEIPKHLSFLDYYRIILSFLLIIVGGIVVYRSLTETLILGIALGGAMFAFGIYRVKFVLDYFKQKGQEGKGARGQRG